VNENAINKSAPGTIFHASLAPSAYLRRVSTSRTGLTRCVARAHFRAPSAGARVGLCYRLVRDKGMAPNLEHGERSLSRNELDAPGPEGQRDDVPISSRLQDLCDSWKSPRHPARSAFSVYFVCIASRSAPMPHLAVTAHRLPVALLLATSFARWPIDSMSSYGLCPSASFRYSMPSLRTASYCGRSLCALPCEWRFKRNTFSTGV
jgi:hypothetical protein